MTGYWIYMTVVCLLVPATMIGVGIYFKKGGPKEINGLFGYRTSMSMKNIDTWRFAHECCGKLWLRIGLIVLPMSVAVMLFFIGKSVDAISNAGLAVILLQMVILIASIFLTESELKRTFNGAGNRR